jgi:peptide deformylase
MSGVTRSWNHSSKLREPMGDVDHHHDHDHDDRDLAEERERAVRRQIALAQVRQYGDPVLRMRAGRVDAFDQELVRLAEHMVGIMHDAEGIGLAATQIGILRRLFVFHDGGEDRVIVNPEITRSGGDLETIDEGCLSLGPVRVPVERRLEVTLEGKDTAGEPFTLELEGLSARVAQHELDHLDGTLIIDRTDADSRRDALSKLRPRLLLSR